ncbi:MAG: sigma-54-dependent Fis family transcriptional regulator [Candidatus Atribacteria bacterium]|nr:MAG: sigma-54-dependent Fis family transcriptional regulator [Candidatus Atribacteria bacterium]
MRYGAYDFLEKPFNMDTLELSLTKIIRQQEILRENIELKGQIRQYAEGLDQMVGSNPKMQKLYDQIITAADTDLTVLILGETGTGKELVARSVHSRSDRRSKPFVIINCAAVPENLLESEFFGHEKGAFSGAISQRIGKFEKAHTGTLFLDEIGDIPLELQAKILRVIEDGKITRLGSNREIELDFRVICATNRPIGDMIKKELFRKDLYYRISVLPIIIPPLRERKDDISLLTSHFISKYSKKLGSNVKGISQQAMQQLLAYSWPGNVREFENLIQRSMVSTRLDVIERFPDLGMVEDETESAPAGIMNEESTIWVDVAEGAKYHTIKQSMIEQFESRYLGHLLKKHNGVIAEAARESGLNYKTFYLKVEKYNLSKKRSR